MIFNKEISNKIERCFEKIDERLPYYAFDDEEINDIKIILKELIQEARKELIEEFKKMIDEEPLLEWEEEIRDKLKERITG